MQKLLNPKWLYKGLGGGCAKCNQLAEAIKQPWNNLVGSMIEHVTDFFLIAA